MRLYIDQIVSLTFYFINVLNLILIHAAVLEKQQ